MHRLVCSLLFAAACGSSANPPGIYAVPEDVPDTATTFRFIVEEGSSGACDRPWNLEPSLARAEVEREAPLPLSGALYLPVSLAQYDRLTAIVHAEAIREGEAARVAVGCKVVEVPPNTNTLVVPIPLE